MKRNIIIAVCLLSLISCKKNDPSPSNSNNQNNNTTPTTNIITINDGGKTYTTTFSGTNIVNRPSLGTASLAMQGTNGDIDISVGVWGDPSDLGIFTNKRSSSLNNDLELYPNGGANNGVEYNVDSSVVNVTSYAKGSTWGTDQVTGDITLYLSYLETPTSTTLLYKTVTGSFTTNKGGTSEE